MTARPRIMIVDDKAENRVALRRVLADIDADIVEAGNGNDALTATLDRDFALAILDVMMPGMDGFELASLLRGDARTHHLPIIFLTALAGDEMQVFKGYETGAVDYIVKPFHPEVLLAKVKVFLELERQRAELAAANRELDTFAYAVSHDLRAPLRALKGFTAALIEDAGEGLDEQARTDLDQIGRASQRMGALIEGILDLSRSTRGELRLERVDLSSMAERLLQELASAEPARRVTWQVEPGLEAWGDPRMIEALMANLLGNAWKYTGHADQASIRFYRQGEVFCVTDNGAGFDMALAAQLFQPFRRLHREDEFPGIGIGLATAQRIVHRHGGDINAASRPGQGATFSFTLGGRSGSKT